MAIYVSNKQLPPSFDAKTFDGMGVKDSEKRAAKAAAHAALREKTGAPKAPKGQKAAATSATSSPKK